MATTRMDLTTSKEINEISGRAYRLLQKYPSALKMVATQLNIPQLPTSPTPFAMYLVTNATPEQEIRILRKFREHETIAETMNFCRKHSRPKFKTAKKSRPTEEPNHDTDSNRFLNTIRSISSLSEAQNFA